MYKVDIQNKSLLRLQDVQYADLKIRERFDIQEWIAKDPSILGESLLIIQKEFELPSGIRLDLLALDKNGNLVIIELKRDNSGKNTEWQAIKYASYCSTMTPERIVSIYSTYKKISAHDAEIEINAFIDTDISEINSEQRIILVSKDFHSDVASAVLWLRDYDLNIKCIRLRPFIDTDGDLFITPDVIIPLPEAKDYINSKEARQREAKNLITQRTLYSVDQSDHDHEILSNLLKGSLTRDSDLTPRLIEFLKLLATDDRFFPREEIKKLLFESGYGSDIGHTGRLLSTISQFVTKPANSHLRQIIEFQANEMAGERKEAYRIKSNYITLVKDVLNDVCPTPLIQ